MTVWLTKSLSIIFFFSEPMLFQVKAIRAVHCSKSQQRQSRDTVAKGSPSRDCRSTKHRAAEEQWHFHIFQPTPLSMPTWVCGKESRNIKEIKLLAPLHLSLTPVGEFCLYMRMCGRKKVHSYTMLVRPGNSVYSMCVGTGFSGIGELSGCRYLFTVGLANLFPVESWDHPLPLRHHYLLSLTSLQCLAQYNMVCKVSTLDNKDTFSMEGSLCLLDSQALPHSTDFTSS